MRAVVALDGVRRPPERVAILGHHGIPADAEVPERVERLIERAVERYGALVQPLGVYQEIDKEAFAGVYRGDGDNAHSTPLESIYPRADRLALFTITLGAALSEEIGRLFRRNEPALGYMLDAIASDRADAAAELAGRRYLDSLVRDGRIDPSAQVLAYSPGYCGWNVTGQRALFRSLGPEEIGVSLNESCLMQPLKSVSGVLVIGPGKIHKFDMGFDFCESCATHQCRQRIASVVVRGGGARIQL